MTGLPLDPAGLREVPWYWTIKRREELWRRELDARVARARACPSFETPRPEDLPSSADRHGDTFRRAGRAVHQISGGATVGDPFSGDDVIDFDVAALDANLIGLALGGVKWSGQLMLGAMRDRRATRKIPLPELIIRMEAPLTVLRQLRRLRSDLALEGASLTGHRSWSPRRRHIISHRSRFLKRYADVDIWREEQRIAQGRGRWLDELSRRGLNYHDLRAAELIRIKSSLEKLLLRKFAEDTL